MGLQFVSLNGDPRLSDVEASLLRRLIVRAAAVPRAKLHRWFGDGAMRRWPAEYRREASRIAAATTHAAQRAAIAMSALTADEMTMLEACVEQHPHTRFLGFDEPERLREALLLAHMRCHRIARSA